MTNFEKLYNEVIKKSLVEKFGYKNPHEIPKLTKIVLNMGVADAITDKKKLNNAVEEMALIAGQKPLVTKARKSIATFKLREGMPIGCKVTLRSDRMYEFLERLINMALPRIRDFHGITGKNFDGKGNFAFGIKEQIIFPEINYFFGNHKTNPCFMYFFRIQLRMRHCYHMIENNIWTVFFNTGNDLFVIIRLYASVCY